MSAPFRYRILDEGDQYAAITHVQNCDDLGGGAATTLCGWTDVHHEFSDAPVDCPSCLAIIRFCRDLRLSDLLKAA